MSRLLPLLTTENVAYAERARTVRSTALQYAQHTLFEVMEPGLRVRALYESYEDNLFLCEHPNTAGWSVLSVAAPMDYRGVPQSMSYLGTETRRDVLFRAWLDRPSPEPPVAAFEKAIAEFAGEQFRSYDRPPLEVVPALMMLRAGGPAGDALRTMHALGRWPAVAAFAGDHDLLAVAVDGLQSLPD